MGFSEFAVFWNTPAHIDKGTALVHIKELGALTPPVGIESEYMPTPPSLSADALADLDTADELAIRSLILSIVHRTLGDFSGSRAFLHDAPQHSPNVEISTWVAAVAFFELALLQRKDGERMASEHGETKTDENGEKRMLFDRHTFKVARETLAHSHALCTKEMDLSSRLDSWIVMLRTEIKQKMDMVEYEDGGR